MINTQKSVVLLDNNIKQLEIEIEIKKTMPKKGQCQIKR